MERDTGKQQEVRRQLADAKNAKSTRLLSLEMPKSQTHTHGHTRAHAATPANEIMLKLTLKSMQRFHVLAFNSRAFASPSLSSLLAVRLCLVLIGNHMLSAYIKIVINLNKQETG